MMKEKFKYSNLKFLFFFLPVLYGCSTTQVSTLSKPYRHKTYTPKTEIFVPYSIQKELNQFKLRPWKYIVIHHSASDSGNADSIGKYHKKNRGWVNGLGYDFVIGNGSGSRDGQIEVGNRWNRQIDGAHAGNAEYNKNGIGICLIGNFEHTSPTKSQMSSLFYLINYLQKRCHIHKDNIIYHKTFKKTACPGKYFPYNEIKARFK